MDLSVTRKVLSCIITVFCAICVCVLAVSLLLSSTLGSVAFLEKHFVTDALVAECNAQLDARYAALEAETGVPLRVFQAAETNYSTKTALTSAFRNLFTEESSSLYSQTMVNYFEGLITEYLDADRARYQAEDVRRTADAAAKIFSEVVGIHRVDTARIRMTALKNDARRATTVSSIVLLLCAALMLVLLYRNSAKAYVYLLTGAAAGGGGAFLASLLCLIFGAHRKVIVSPVIYQSVFSATLRAYFIYLALIAVVITAVSFVAVYIMYNKAHKTSERKLIF